MSNVRRIIQIKTKYILPIYHKSFEIFERILFYLKNRISREVLS